jgi:hypothetical protein
MKLGTSIFIMVMLISSASATAWSGGVGTESGSWSIYRESNTIRFDLEQSVNGTVSPITGPGGRTLRPYGSYFGDVNMNDVRLRQRTAAKEGNYSSEEQLRLISEAINPANMTMVKPAGSDLFTFDWYEKWPVVLSYSNSMSYIGKGINHQETAGNNLDYAGANFLSSKTFTKDSSINMRLERMNVTVLATNKAIVEADFKATRDTDYRIRAHSTGIADLKYSQSGSKYLPVIGYTAVNYDDERFVGTFDIDRQVHMSSEFKDLNTTDEWLPCCSGGFLDMPAWEQKVWQSKAGIFDCTCYTPPKKALL